MSVYEAAYKAGDLDEVARLSAQPFGFVYEQGFLRARRVGEAKRAIAQAIKERFGGPEETIPDGLDDDQIRQRMQTLDSLFIVSRDTAMGKSVALKVEATRKSGQIETWTLVANRPSDPGGSWAAWPRGFPGTAEIGTSESWRRSLETLAKAYDAVAEEIRDGQ